MWTTTDFGKFDKYNAYRLDGHKLVCPAAVYRDIYIYTVLDQISVVQTGLSIKLLFRKHLYQEVKFD